MKTNQKSVRLDINAILKQNCSKNNSDCMSKQNKCETWIVTNHEHSHKKWTRVQYRKNGQKIDKWFMKNY